MTLAHPGYVKTAIARRARALSTASTSAWGRLLQIHKIAITKPELVGRKRGQDHLERSPQGKATGVGWSGRQAFHLVWRTTGSGYQRLFLPLSRRMQPPTR